MRIDVVTLFPEAFDSVFSVSIIKRAKEEGKLDLRLHNLRDWAKDERRTVDDRPFGGGVGMILMIEPIFDALNDLKKENPDAKVILLSPAGALFDQAKAEALSKEGGLILICGHYEGVDERVRKHLANETISIGNYILTGGELPAMVLIDAVARILPGVLKKEKASEEESFSLTNKKGKPLLEYPQYTRPENFRGLKVPKILLSGNHEKIKKWRDRNSKIAKNPY